jgi:acetolactate synthase small subunit
VPKSFPTTRRIAAISVERFTLAIRADNEADILARVVLLFHRLHVEIDVLYMVRPRNSDAMRMNITIQSNRESSRRVEAHLYKVAHVRSVHVERARHDILGEPNEKQSKRFR